MKSYYAILQLSENADHEEIRHAYRRLAKLYHPDVNKSQDAHEKFCEITEAYEFLMNHWPKHIGQYTGATTYEQKYQAYQQTVSYAEFLRESQERARWQAKMRYEKFRKQHEAFQESGLNDIGLLFTIIFRLLSLPLFLLLLLTPFVLAILAGWKIIFTGLFMWPFAGGIAWYYRDNRNHYFLPGRFYYSPERIKHLFTKRYPTSQQCYYCKGKTADSKPYNVELLKLKEVKYTSAGYRQHNVNYVNKPVNVMIPRSQKAFFVHTLNIFIKLLSIAGCMIFLDLSSMVWRFIFGLVTGAVLCRVHLILTNTRSNVTYLLSFGLLIRISVWMLCICLVSLFYTDPIDIYTTDVIYFVITAIIIFDSFLMQLIGLVIGRNSSRPIIPQHSEISSRFSEGYQVYNDVPVISIIYPLFRWVFG